MSRKMERAGICGWIRFSHKIFLKEELGGEEGDCLHFPAALRADEGGSFIHFAGHLGPVYLSSARPMPLSVRPVT